MWGRSSWSVSRSGRAWHGCDFCWWSRRGLGIGRRLVQECTRFARQAGYSAITLWTNDVLVSARRIYEAEGYRLVREEPHDSFGAEVVSQDWELAL